MAIQGNRGRTWLVVSILLASVVLFRCGGSSKEKYPVTVAPGGKPDPVLVKKLYDTKCAICHGFDGRQSYAGAKDLGSTTMNRDQIIHQIAEGKGAMPPQKDVLSKEQIEALSDFVLSLRVK